MSKTLADNKTNITQQLKFVLGGVENILGKGENLGYQHFLIFGECFHSSSGSLELILWYRVKN